MAVNWTLKEAKEAIDAGNKEAIVDIGKRFPLTTVLLAKMPATESVKELLGALPEHITARKIEKTLKDGVIESDEDLDEDVAVTEDGEEVEEKPVKAKRAPKEKPVKEKKEKPVKKDEEEVTSDESVDYSTMNAVDLFKLCKKRGIKTEPKQKAAAYIKLLEAADEPVEEKASDEDEWDI